MATLPLTREQLIERLMDRIRQMPDEQVQAVAVLVEVLPTAQQHEGISLHIVTVPFGKVRELYDLVQVGGDALLDSQRLYD